MGSRFDLECANVEEQALKTKSVPPCVGYYEVADSNCDGDPQGASENERRPCGWQARCAAFQRYLEDEGRLRDEFLDVVEEPVLDSDGRPKLDGAGEPVTRETCRAKSGDEAFSQFCEGLTRKDEPPLIEQLAQDRRCKTRLEGSKPRKPRKVSRYPGVAERRKHLRVRFEKFLARLFEVLGPERKKRDRCAALIGQVYLSDSSAKATRYIAVYCRATGYDRPLVRVKFLAAYKAFDAWLPVGCTDLKRALGVKGRAATGEVTPAPREGRFLSRVRRLDDDGLAAVACAIGVLIERGKIELPPAPRSAE